MCGVQPRKFSAAGEMLGYSNRAKEVSFAIPGNFSMARKRSTRSAKTTLACPIMSRTSLWSIRLVADIASGPRSHAKIDSGVSTRKFRRCA